LFEFEVERLVKMMWYYAFARTYSYVYVSELLTSDQCKIYDTPVSSTSKKLNSE